VAVVQRQHRPVIERLADLFAFEWPDWAATLSRDALEETFISAEGGGLPLVLAALEGEDPVGTVALRGYFGEEPMEHSPWVRGLYVLRSHRGRGIDRLLMRAVEHEARARGYDRMYASTTRIERLGERWGWKVFHRLDHHGEPMAWLCRELGANAH
jgi:GNAT superfamily N-acetyltransferase